MLVVMPGTCSSTSVILRRTSSLAKPGWTVISISELLTGSACSSRSARPVRRVTVRTPSCWSSRRSIAEAMRSLAGSEVPGGANRPTVNVPSLNSGRNEVPKVAPSHRHSAVAAPALPITSARWRSVKRSAGS